MLCSIDCESPMVLLCRCERAIPGSGLPRVCEQFYGEDEGFYNITFMNGLRSVTDNLKTEFSNFLGDADPCVQYVLNYICYYYYPVCNLTTGVVSYACISSCGLLVNNQHCSDLLSLASDRIEDANIPEPEADCGRPARLPEEPTVVAEECISIEGKYSKLYTLYIYIPF